MIKNIFDKTTKTNRKQIPSTSPEKGEVAQDVGPSTILKINEKKVMKMPKDTATPYKEQAIDSKSFNMSQSQDLDQSSGMNTFGKLDFEEGVDFDDSSMLS